MLLAPTGDTSPLEVDSPAWPGAAWRVTWLAARKYHDRNVVSAHRIVVQLPTTTLYLFFGFRVDPGLIRGELLAIRYIGV